MQIGIEFFFVYLAVWWITLFLTLPFGVDRVENPEAGHDSGAPVEANMKKKIIANSIIALIITAGIMISFYTGWVDLRNL